jgi:DNA polymerase III subunit beta
MKFTANAGALADALALAASCCDDKQVRMIAALSAVHIKTADGAVNITSNVLDFAITLNAPANVETPGEVAVNGPRVAALVAAFPDTATVEIAHDGAIACVAAGRSRFKLATVPLADLPPVPKLVEQTGHIDLAREEMSALWRVGFAMEKEKTRFHLRGILLHNTPEGLVAVATNGHRLARVVIPGAAGLSQDFKLIVPAAAVKIATKVIGEKDIERVTLRRSTTLLAVETAKAAFVSKLIDGTFPDFRRLLLKPSGNAVTVDRAELAQALERVAAVAAERNRVVVLHWAADAPVLRLSLTDSEIADDAIDAEVTGGGRIAVQIKYLNELLDVIKGERVHFDARSAGDPMLVTDPDDESFLALQMGCRGAQAQAA